MKFKLDNARFLAGFTDKFSLSSGEIYSPRASKNGEKNVEIYGGLNLALHVGDSAVKVMQNRENLALNLGVSARDLVFMNQIHTDKICVIDENFLAKFRREFDEIFGLNLSGEKGGLEEKFSGLQNEQISRKLSEIFPVCDALITDLSGVALCVMVADCSPVLLVDEVCGAVGAVHAGRAGVTAKICSKTALKMVEIYGSKMSDLRVFTGANIKGGCYEVAGLDLGEFERYKTGGKFDMNAALRDEFSALGIKNAEFEPECTHCDERFYSYRRDGATGRFAGFVLKR